jgi:hypothetical protein
MKTLIPATASKLHKAIAYTIAFILALSIALTLGCAVLLVS